MKKILILILSIMIFKSLYGQVGINTTNIHDGVVLEVYSENKGILLPSVALTSLTNKSPLIGDVPTGTTIFNTANFGSFPNEVKPGFYWWDNENSQWMPMANSLKNVTCQYRNQNSSTNFHPNGTANVGVYQDMDLFANLVFNENYDVFEKINATSLKVNMSGLYAITINLDMYKNGDNNPEGLSTRIVVNDIQKGTVQYWRGQENENEFSHHFTEYLELQEGDVLKIQTARATTTNNSQVLRMRAPNTSDITIQRIR